MISRETYLNKEEISSIQHNIVMYGAGTQSTGMILQGLTSNVKLDFAVFADTGGEPNHVIEYKEYFTEYCKNEFDFEIVTVSHGSLEKDVFDYIDGKKSRVAALPLRSKTGMLMRQCTADYKINPTNKYIKKRLGIKRKNKEQNKIVAKWMGISVDEIQRLKISQDWWNSNVYPLVENGFRREDTIKLVKSFGLIEPPRSACYFCPFHSPNYWEFLRKTHKEEFEKAIIFDEKIRDYPKMRAKMYLHRQTIPLKDVVNNQTDLIGLIDECDGYCGI